MSTQIKNKKKKLKMLRIAFGITQVLMLFLIISDITKIGTKPLCAIWLLSVLVWTNIDIKLRNSTDSPEE